MAPRAPPNRGELYRRKTLFLDDFPIFFFIRMRPGPTHPLPIFFGFLEFFELCKTPKCRKNGFSNRTRKLSGSFEHKHFGPVFDRLVRLAAACQCMTTLDTCGRHSLFNNLRRTLERHDTVDILRACMHVCVST